MNTERLQEALKAADQGKSDGLLGLYPMAAQVLAAEVRRLEYQVQEWEKLGDPLTLHVNLLRGIPCKLDRATFLHLAGDDVSGANGKPATSEPVVT